MVERRFPRAVGSLDAIFAFVEEFIAARAIDPEHAYDVGLVIEELFTNMVRHSRDGRHEIAIGLDSDAVRITIVVRDFDVERWDITAAKPVDIGAPLAERRPGGLGIHFVKRIAEDLRYDYRDRTSTITVTKRLSP